MKGDARQKACAEVGGRWGGLYRFKTGQGVFLPAATWVHTGSAELIA